MRFVLVAVSIAALAAPAFAGDVYFNDFNGAPGTTYPEWTCSGYSNSANHAGTVAAGAGPQPLTNVASPNGKERFLGEFGGPAIVSSPPYDPQHFVRVDETVTLTLRNLKPHYAVTVTFDLYILKSWDGNNPNYGPDRWSLSVQGGRRLLDTTFSNNPKTGAYDLSLQNYPAANSPPQTAASSVNTLGYKFYGDSIYHLTFTFPHKGDVLALNFSSSLFEGKGTEDESWGLDNVRVSTSDRAPSVDSAVAPTQLGTDGFEQAAYSSKRSFCVSLNPSRDGGTGRRSGLKIRRPSGHGGSSPFPGTISFQTLSSWDLQALGTRQDTLPSFVPTHNACRN